MFCLILFATIFDVKASANKMFSELSEFEIKYKSCLEQFEKKMKNALKLGV